MQGGGHADERRQAGYPFPVARQHGGAFKGNASESREPKGPFIVRHFIKATRLGLAWVRRLSGRRSGPDNAASDNADSFG